jgi:phosphoglycerate dehydrogenase-like enzyme
MKLVFYNKLNRFWLEKIEGLKHEFSQADFVTERDRVDVEIESADALPFDLIRKHCIRVANVHGNAPYVAERAMTMALAFYGKLIDFHNDLRNRQWHGYWVTGNVKDSWTSMQGRTAAIIGTGAIGSYIARYLKAFGCRVIGFKRKPVIGVPEFFDEITLDLNRAVDQGELD